ncbi:c-type cytochrome [Terrimonas pollutisoli]|uniref:c-type cytochrome n=1 Tax=Terrimonas pollutisoli TaxID=3034147 RepID=UPI0023EADD11|nr:c-type cytochrome [Terrimonas sp. H1YJ31]
MIIKKQFIIVFLLMALVTAGVAAVTLPKPKHKNLKILPQDISEFMLDSIMESYTKALGVSCKFCHVPFKNFPDSLDYASDDEPMKENARKMMRMTIHLNKTYFNFDTTTRPEYLKVVNCKTCHRGEPYPVD